MGRDNPDHGGSVRDAPAQVSLVENRGGRSLSRTGGWNERGADQRSGKSLGNQLWTETSVGQQLTNASARHRGLATLTSAIALDLAS